MRVFPPFSFRLPSATQLFQVFTESAEAFPVLFVRVGHGAVLRLASEGFPALHYCSDRVPPARALTIP